MGPGQLRWRAPMLQMRPCHESREFARGHGPAEKEPLDFVASLLAKEGHLLRGLDTFRDDFEVQAVRHGDGGPDDGLVAAA